MHGIPSSLDLDRSASSAKSGRAEMRDKLSKNNSGGAAITAGDVDADWQSAESVGDEAPGGDNPTPDQDRVDDIGRALGVEYADDEELQGGAEIADRDLNRWELDPASKDDFDDEGLTETWKFKAEGLTFKVELKVENSNSSLRLSTQL